jgi:hypothetical protein
LSPVSRLALAHSHVLAVVALEICPSAECPPRKTAKVMLRIARCDESSIKEQIGSGRLWVLWVLWTRPWAGLASRPEHVPLFFHPDGSPADESQRPRCAMDAMRDALAVPARCPPPMSRLDMCRVGQCNASAARAEWSPHSARDGCRALSSRSSSIARQVEASSTDSGDQATRCWRAGALRCVAAAR